MVPAQFTTCCTQCGELAADQAALSYAVGEWARVWPLNHLFKWFGAYFIRRRYREPLYHAVLSTFVSTITKNIEVGEGGHSLAGNQVSRIFGILNGIDPKIWNPQSDVAKPYPARLARAPGYERRSSPPVAARRTWGASRSTR